MYGEKENRRKRAKWEKNGEVGKTDLEKWEKCKFGENELGKNWKKMGWRLKKEDAEKESGKDERKW